MRDGFSEQLFDAQVDVADSKVPIGVLQNRNDRSRTTPNRLTQRKTPKKTRSGC
jgi:hypothetical protein